MKVELTKEESLELLHADMAPETCSTCAFARVKHRYFNGRLSRTNVMCQFNLPPRNDEDYGRTDVTKRTTICGEYQPVSLQTQIDSIDWHRHFKALQNVDVLDRSISEVKNGNLHRSPDPTKQIKDLETFTDGFHKGTWMMEEMRLMLKAKGYKEPKPEDYR